MEVFEEVTPPLEEFGEISGISISRTTTAISWKNSNEEKKAGTRNEIRRKKN